MLSSLAFFGALLTVLLGVHAYIASRLLGPSGLSETARRRARRAIIACALVGPLGMLAAFGLPASPITQALAWLGYLAMGEASLLFFAMLLRDVGFGVLALVDRVAGGRLLPVDDERRRVLLAGANLVLGSATVTVAAMGWREARRVPGVVRVTVPIVELPAALDGLTIAQLTDIHIGPTIKGSWLAEVVAATNALGADLIAVTGDLIDGRVEELRADVAPLGDLAAPLGVYFVTGNHEYYWDAAAWLAEVGRLGLTPLENAHRVVERGGAPILVAGVNDLSAARMGADPCDPARAAAGAPPGALRLLLAHQPRVAPQARDAGYHLQLSGHTHGGQYVPFNWLVRLVQPFTAGLSALDDLQVYVSRGTGYWGPPMRVGAPSEITLLTLRRVPVGYA